MVTKPLKLFFTIFCMIFFTIPAHAAISPKYATNFPQNFAHFPVGRFVSSSTTLLPYWKILGVEQGLIGQGWIGYIFDAEGFDNAQDIGPGNNVNIERVLALAPDAAFLYASSPGEREVARRLENLGVRVVMVGEYLETHPLGRVEWLAFLAPFFGTEAEKRAEKYINETIIGYEALKKIAQNVRERPDVIMNAAWGGAWHVPGGQSLFANFVRDAGGSYNLETSERSDGVPLDIETIFSRGENAKFWLHPSAWGSLAEGLREDSRYALFKSFKEGNVYNNTRRMSAAGGNDFHEGGVLRPDIVLADLISIFHPELLPEHKLFYYKKLF